MATDDLKKWAASKTEQGEPSAAQAIRKLEEKARDNAPYEAMHTGNKAAAKARTLHAAREYEKAGKAHKAASDAYRKAGMTEKADDHAKQSHEILSNILETRKKDAETASENAHKLETKAAASGGPNDIRSAVHAHRDAAIAHDKLLANHPHTEAEKADRLSKIEAHDKASNGTYSHWKGGGK